MPDREFPRPYDAIAQRWRDLAERRRQHIVELYESGRWRHYYTEVTLVEGLREAIRDVERWDTILNARPRALPEAGENRAEPVASAVQDTANPLDVLIDILRIPQSERPHIPRSDAA